MNVDSRAIRLLRGSQMGKSFIVAMMFLLYAHTFSIASAESRQSRGLALIKRAVELTDLSRSGPYRMQSKVLLGETLLGDETVAFASSEKWRRDFRTLAVDDIEVLRGDRIYRARIRHIEESRKHFSNVIYTAKLLGSLPEAVNYRVASVYTEKLNGGNVRCVDMKERLPDPMEVTWCFAPETGLPVAKILRPTASDDLLRIGGTVWAQPFGYDRVEFTDYIGFGNRFVPRLVRRVLAGRVLTTSRLQEIVPSLSGDSHFFDPPDNAEAQPWCEEVRPPRLKNAALPQIPEEAFELANNPIFYEISIRADGTVERVVPSYDNPAMDQAIVGALNHWLFMPARCGGTRVAATTSIYLQTIITACSRH